MGARSGADGGHSRQRGAIEAMGSPTMESRPGTANLVAGIIIAIVLIGGGAALILLMIRDILWHGGRLPLFAERGICWAAVGFFSVVEIAMVIGGLALLRWVRSTSSLRVHVCPGGFYHETGGRTGAFPWGEISSIRETILKERVPLAKGIARYAMPVKTSRQFLVRGIDGDESGFDGNTIW